MISETWTYASANSVTYAGDLTAIYSPGMRVRLTQGTVKYFVIVSVVYSDPDTTITFYGGGIYSLTEDPITSHDATASAIPQGFPTPLLRVSTVLDGFCPALPNDTAKFYRGDGTWQTPAGYVTNGDAHDHNGGDGAQVDHGGLASLSDDDHPQYIKHSLATAVNDFLVASGAGSFAKKTLAEVKTALGLGSAAYTASTDYATAAKGVTNGDAHDHSGGDGAQIDHGGLAGLSDDDHPQYIKHSLATAVNDFLVASGAGAFAKKTLAEVKTALGLGSAAYTASTDYATAAKGVTNGDAHDHSGGDGAQIDHGGLAGLSDDDHPQYIKHSLATAVNDFLVASGAGAFAKKTLAEVKTALGLGSAAYTASTDYATAAKGVTNGDSHDHNGGDGAQVDHGGLAGLSDDDHPQYIKHSLATAANDFLVASGAGAFAKKTLEEVKTALGLGSAAYTASTDYATAAKGVTNGDSHDHNGGDGAQVDHGGLAGLSDDDHPQYIKHSLATAANDMLMASGAGAFAKKTLAEVKTALGLGSAAYTASTDYATAAKGVTNGDSHDHNGGDGAQVDHGGLAGLSDDDHPQYEKRTSSHHRSDARGLDDLRCQGPGHEESRSKN